MVEINDPSWLKWYDFIESAFDSERYKNYKNKSGYYRVNIDFYSHLQDVYEKHKNDNRFDEQLNKIFAFLEADGMLDHFEISFEEWITMKNFYNPKGRIIMPIEKSISELCQTEEGKIQLKEKLRQLFWWHISRGDLQGT